MGLLLQMYLQQFLVFVLVLTRIGTLVFTLPSISGSGVPMQVRALLAVTIALLVTPLQWGHEVPEPANLAHLTSMLAKEGMLGLALGATMNLLLAGMQLAGQVIGQVSGFSLADVLDPTFDESISIFAQLLETVAVSIFFIVGGHRLLIDALISSFTWMPPGQGDLPSDLPEALTDIAGRSFEVALRAAAPVMVSLLLATLIVAVISRTLPQLNSLALGMNLNALVVLGSLAVCIGSAMWVFEAELVPSIQQIVSVFSAQALPPAESPTLGGS
jgi:flagellar biosynthetic protein FliR